MQQHLPCKSPPPVVVFPEDAPELGLDEVEHHVRVVPGGQGDNAGDAPANIFISHLILLF